MRLALVLLFLASAARADSLWGDGSAVDGRSAERGALADEADFRFHRGAQLFRQGKVEEALGEFLASNHLVHNRNAVFNIARSFELLRRHNEAYRWYSDILAEENVPDGDRKAVEEALRRLQPSLALLRVESDPPGATVYIDRKDLGARGQTPMVLALPAGKVAVLAELPGYRPAAAQAQLNIGATAVANLTLQRIWGALFVSGEPDGAELHLDRPDSPSLPARGRLQVLPGEHLVFLSKPGFTGEQMSVLVPPDGAVPIQFRLTPLLPPSGKVVVRANVDRAEVRIDGRMMGFTPDVIDVTAGTHTLEVAAEGREPERTLFAVRDGDRTFMDLKLRHQQPRVVAAERQLTRAEDAPASVTIIGHEEIRAFGYTTLAQALRSVRGLYATSDRSYDSFGVRGFSPPGVYNNKVLVLSDGHVTNDISSGQGFIGRDFDVDLDDVERIEVVRGPGSVMYGSAAFFAVINVVHRAAGEGQRFQAGAGMASLGESTGTLQASMGGGGSGITARVAGLRGDGENVFAAPPRDLPQQFAIGFDDEKAGHADLRAHSGDFALAAVFNRRDKTIPTGPWDTFGLSGTQNTDQRFFAEGTFSHDFSGLGLDARASYDGARNAADYAIKNSDPGHATRNADWGEGEVRLRLPELFGNHLFAGGEVQRIFRTELFIVVPGSVAGDQRHTQTVASGYLGDDLQLGRRVKISAAVRYDAYFGEAGVPDPQINPRIAVITEPYTGGRLKLMGGTAYRAPTLNERYFHNGQQIAAEGTPPELGRGTSPNHLEPEKVRTLEFEHTHQLGEETQLVLAGYWSRIDQIIRLKSIKYADVSGAVHSGVFRFQNKSALTFSAGLEGEVRWQPMPGALLSLWYSFNRIANNNESPDVPNAPAHTGALRAMFPLAYDRLSLSTEVVYNSYRLTTTDATYPSAERIGEQLLWNAGISGQYAPWRLRYGAFVDNLLDQQVLLPGGLEIPFQSHAVPQIGRTFRVAAGASF
ncbi:MAG TPA: TonB-dependent receptor [Myxococcales bacterium]